MSKQDKLWICLAVYALVVGFTLGAMHGWRVLPERSTMSADDRVVLVETLIGPYITSDGNLTPAKALMRNWTIAEKVGVYSLVYLKFGVAGDKEAAWDVAAMAQRQRIVENWDRIEIARTMSEIQNACSDPKLEPGDWSLVLAMLCKRQFPCASLPSNAIQAGRKSSL